MQDADLILGGGVSRSVTHTSIQGDDVLARLRSWVSIAALHACFVSHGHRLNPAKQLIGKQYGVFLRIMLGGGGARGYLARSVGSFVM